MEKLARRPEANLAARRKEKKKKKRNEPWPFFRVTRLHCAGLIPRRLVMSRRTRARTCYPRQIYISKPAAREPSKCTSKLTLHRPSIEPHPSLLSSSRAKNGNYCRPTTIVDLFFFFFYPPPMDRREPAIYCIFPPSQYRSSSPRYIYIYIHILE